MLEKFCKKCNKISMFYLSKKDNKPLKICKFCIKERNKIYWNKNKDRLTSDEKRIKKRRINDATWRKKHPHKVKTKARNYIFYLALSIPKWITEEIKFEIDKIYDSCPDGFEVDHIEPIRGKEICGLHLPWNLQYLPSSLNSKKSNRRIYNE